jgi:hypothetical protein
LAFPIYLLTTYIAATDWMCDIVHELERRETAWARDFLPIEWIALLFALNVEQI